MFFSRHSVSCSHLTGPCLYLASCRSYCSSHLVLGRKCLPCEMLNLKASRMSMTFTTIPDIHKATHRRFADSLPPLCVSKTGPSIHCAAQSRRANHSGSCDQRYLIGNQPLAHHFHIRCKTQTIYPGGCRNDIYHQFSEAEGSLQESNRRSAQPTSCPGRCSNPRMSLPHSSLHPKCQTWHRRVQDPSRQSNNPFLTLLKKKHTKIITQNLRQLRTLALATSTNTTISNLPHPRSRTRIWNT